MSHPTDPPLIVTLGLDPASFDRLDRLRLRHFPPDRNFIPAHISLFHHLPGEEADEVVRTLARVARAHPPVSLRFPGVKRMARGVLATVEAPGLAAIRSGIARAFASSLTEQDRQPFRAHVTLMNKVDPDEAATALGEIRSAWAPWSGLGESLLLWRYRGGPWEDLGAYPFTGKVAEDPEG